MAAEKSNDVPVWVKWLGYAVACAAAGFGAFRAARSIETDSSWAHLASSIHLVGILLGLGSAGLATAAGWSMLRAVRSWARSRGGQQTQLPEKPAEGLGSHLPARMIGVPHRNPFFTGREKLLEQLHRQLQTKGITALAQAAIHGLGGVGKTQTAIEYAHRYRKHYRFVLWVGAEQEASLAAAYLSIARELELVEPRADLETAQQAIKAWLSSEEGWLLVFDNADEPGLLRAYLPSVRMGGKVLLTSRAKIFTDVGINEPFRVQTMEPEEAVKFLLTRTKREEAGAAAELSTELGYLPLALEQAAAYVDTVAVSFSAYLASFKKRRLQLLEKGKPSGDYPASVATTWNLSFAQVRKASAASAELLTAASFLAPDSVPIEIFTLGGSELGDLLAEGLKAAAEDPLVYWELLAPLERYSLVERLPDEAFKIHRLTQEVVKDSLGKEGRRSWAERVVRALDATYPGVTFENWKLCERLQPNAKLALRLARTYNLELAEAGHLLHNAGWFAFDRGDTGSARILQECSLALYERLLGAEHPNTLGSSNNLANTLRVLGDLAGARKLQEKTLETQERVLGTEHPDTLGSRNSLAVSLRDLGDFDGAKRLQEQTLESRERLQGAEHPDTLTSRNNLAIILTDLGDLPGAVRLHDQTLKILERVLGAEHPLTLVSRNNLAGVLWSLGDREGARKQVEQTVKIQERVLGTEHPDTTSSTWNLFLAVRKLGDGDAEAPLLAKLRWLLDRDENSLASDVQRRIRQELLDLLDQY